MKRIHACLAILLLLPLVAAPKKLSEGDAARRDLDKLLERGKFEAAFKWATEKEAVLDPAYRTNVLLDLYQKLNRKGEWQAMLDGLPEGAEKEASLGAFWGAQGWWTRSMGHYARYFTLGGTREGLRPKTTKLLSSEIRFPGHWVLTTVPSDSATESTKSVSFVCPYGARLGLTVADGTLRTSAVEDVNRWVNGFRLRFAPGSEVKQLGFKPKNGSFRGTVSTTKGGFTDPEAILVVLSQVDARTQLRTVLGILVPDRGVEFSCYEFSRSGASVSFSYFVGGPEEKSFVEDLEGLLDSFIQK